VAAVKCGKRSGYATLGGIAAHFGESAGMTEKPQTGEWWECDFARVRIVGHRLDGVAITEAKGGYIGCIKDLTGWKHLTGCDSFEWESPDDWVTQDRVYDRPSIDQWRRVFDGIPDDWRWSTEYEARYMHGHTALGGRSIFEVRCRRKDLPQMQQETPKREYVRLWENSENGTIYTSPYSDRRTDGELKHDGVGFYLAAD
jgi:hypothetical protein